MATVDPGLLTSFAIRVLDEEAARARLSPGRTWAARFALAYIGGQHAEQWALDRYWEAMVAPNDVTRSANLTAALNAISRMCGVGPER